MTNSSNLDRLIAEIMAQAGTEAEAILAQAKNEAAQTSRVAEEEGEKAAQNIAADTQRQIAEEQARIIAAATRESANQIRAAKETIINQTFEAVRKDFAGQVGQSYPILMQNLLLQAVQTGNEKVCWAQADQALGKKIVAQVNQGLKEQGLLGNLQLGEAALPQYHGGFILHGDNYTINATTDILTEIFMDEYEPEVVRILFGEL